MDPTIQLVGYVASGAMIGSAISVPILKYLGRDWLEKRESFERETARQLERLQGLLVGSEKAAVEAVRAVREESVEARRVLREHVDHEDRIIRDRNHELAGNLGVLSNKVEIASLDVREAIAANQKTLEWCQARYADLTDEIHRLALEVAGNAGDPDRRNRQTRK